MIRKCVLLAIAALATTSIAAPVSVQAQGFFLQYSSLQRDDDAERRSTGVRFGQVGRITDGVYVSTSCAYYPKALQSVPTVNSARGFDCLGGLEYAPFASKPVGLVFQAGIGGASLPTARGAVFEELRAENTQRFVRYVGAGVRGRIIAGFSAEAHLLLRRSGESDDAELRLGILKTVGASRGTGDVDGVLSIGTNLYGALSGPYRSAGPGVVFGASRAYGKLSLRASAELLRLETSRSSGEPVFNTGMAVLMVGVEKAWPVAPGTSLGVLGAGGVAVFQEGLDNGFNPAFQTGATLSLGKGPIRFTPELRILAFDRKNSRPVAVAAVPTLGVSVKF